MTHKRSGIGLRTPHIDPIRHNPDLWAQQVGFLEVHPENYFGGGIKLKILETLAAQFPLSFHGVGLSLGRNDPLDDHHLAQIVALNKQFSPFHLSEHLSFSASGQSHVPDLLPLPLTRASLAAMTRNVIRFQEAVGRPVLIENPSTYIEVRHNEMSEPEFLIELMRNTGAKLLLDINNIYVSAQNQGFEAQAYIQALAGQNLVGQYHLAGHDRVQLDDTSQDVLIDTHGKPVCDPVWDLFDFALDQLGDHPTLIEWDTDIPALETLVAEAHRADAHRQHARARTAPPFKAVDHV